MDRHYQLKVTSDTTNIDVDSVDADEVARIVQLAGLKAAPVAVPMSAPPVMEPVDPPAAPTAVDDMGDDLAEETAEFDYGHNRQSDTGNEVDADTYTWTADRLPQHFGKNGDNTLNDPINEAARSIYMNLSDAYRLFLAEESRENDDGIMSPLSDPDIEDFDKDPLAGKPVVDDGSHSPMSTIKRQPALK
jgi:hypothetical protein